MTSRRPSADDGLAVENYTELNRAFYQAEPYEYFKHRLASLLLVAGRPQELEALLRQGVQYGRVRFGSQEDEVEGPHKEELRQHYITAEAETLLHHAAESLLRIYKAHEDKPVCPWLEVSRERNFSDFKKYLAARFGRGIPLDDSRRRVGEVFYGVSDRTKLTPLPSEEEWHLGLDNVEAFLREYASHLLRRAAPYNAAKHGLAISVGDADVALEPHSSDPETRSLIHAEGPSITCLEERRDDRGRWWTKATYWVDIDVSITLTFASTNLLQALWEVARARYLGAPEGGLRLRRFDHLDLSKIREPGIVTDKFAMDLLYYRNMTE